MSVPFKRLMELEAAHLAAQVLQGHAKSRDVRGPGAIDGTHDFDVALPDGRVVALEVTTAARKNRSTRSPPSKGWPMRGFPRSRKTGD